MMPGTFTAGSMAPARTYSGWIEIFSKPDRNDSVSKFRQGYSHEQSSKARGDFSRVLL